MEATLLDCQLHYTLEQNENPDVPVVVLLHGWGCDGNIFSFLKRDIGAQCTVLTLDFPGHGKSAEPSEPWGVPEYAAQVKALLDSLNYNRIYVVAHSFGGRVASVSAVPVIPASL